MFEDRAASVALFGEVLLDELPSGPVPGGAPLNVARHLRAFGLEPLLISRVGRDKSGDLLLSAMRRWGLDTRGVQRDPDHPTGRVLVHLGRGRHRFEILPFQAWDFIDAADAVGVLRSAPSDLLYFGTLAQRHHESRRALWELFGGLTGTRFLDVNLRAPWYDTDTAEASLSAAQIVKLNDVELEDLARIFQLRDGGAARAQGLIERFSVRQVVVTHGARGAGLYEAGTPARRVRGLPLGPRLVDAVGAGDGFAAVLILGSVQGWTPTITLARAESFARAICGIRGAIPEDDRFYVPFLAEWSEAGQGGEPHEREGPLPVHAQHSRSRQGT